MMNSVLTAACFFSVGFVISSVVRDMRMLRAYRLDSSRFPMFAARDALVELVAAGHMKETDEVWARSYLAANRLLHLRSRGDIMFFLNQRMEHEAAMQRDLLRKREFELFLRKARRAVQETPEFGTALEQFGRGINCMIRERTTLLTWTSLLGIHGLARLVAKIREWKWSFRLPSGQKSTVESVMVAAGLPAC